MAGFFGYLRLIFRRERLISSLWIGISVAFISLMAYVYPTFMEDDASRTAMIEILKSPPVVAMIGPAFDTPNYTVSMAFTNIMSLWVMVAFAVMNIFFVNRHTRTDEEQGRAEMLRSFPVGKLANSGATMFGAILLNLVIAVLTTLSLLAINIEGCTVAGAVASSFQIACFGILMAGLTLLFAQLFSTSRGTSSAAFITLGVFYLMRLVGDYDDGILSYISPLGLGLRTFAFLHNNAYPSLIMLLQAAGFTCVSFFICLKRDLGEGVIPAKKGRADAKKSLLSPFGFVIRLSKGTVIAWCLVIFVVAAMCGSMLGDIESFIESNDFYKQMLQYDENGAYTLVESSVVLFFLIMVHIATIPIISISQKLRSEESHGRLEQILGRSVSRNSLLLSFLAVALVQSVLILLCMAFGMFVASYNFDAVPLGQLLTGALCYLPAMWVFAGLATFLTGFLPKLGTIVWVFFGYSFLMLYMGSMLNLPEILQNITPFGNTPKLPTQEFEFLPLAIMTLISALLATLGAWKFSKRDSI